MTLFVMVILFMQTATPTLKKDGVLIFKLNSSLAKVSAAYDLAILADNDFFKKLKDIQ